MINDMYIGNSNNVARKVKQVFIGGNDNTAKRVKRIYIGDSNNKAQLIWDKDYITGIQLPAYISANSPNTTLRKKFLGTVTASTIDDFINSHGINTARFKDLMLGDIITIQDDVYNAKWIIAGFNTQVRTNLALGSYGKNHITLIPLTYLKNNVRMTSTWDNTNGYVGSEMFSTLSSVNYTLSRALGNHLLPHKELLSTNNNSNTGLYEVKAILLNIAQAFGQSDSYSYYHSTDSGTTYKRIYNGTFADGEDNSMLPLFKYDYKYRTIDPNAQYYWWLRDTFKDDCFTSVCYTGDATYLWCGDLQPQYCLRPMICVG